MTYVTAYFRGKNAVLQKYPENPNPKKLSL